MGTIVAVGGGSFTSRGPGSPLDRYVLEASGKPRPRICYIPTASSDPARGVRRFYQAFRGLDCEPSHLDLFRQTVVDVDGFLRAQDVVYVGGGNTRNLLLLWNAWGVDRALRAAHDNGTVLAGVSAGGLCWFREGITDSYPGRLAPLPCLGWIDASFSPHYDTEPGRRPLFEALIARGEIVPGYAADDGVALRFDDGVFREAVADMPGRSGYRIERSGDVAREERMTTRLLAANA